MQLKKGLLEKEATEEVECKEADNAVDASVIEASQNVETARSAVLHDMFENVKALNRGYDHLPGLTVGCISGDTERNLNFSLIQDSEDSDDEDEDDSFEEMKKVCTLTFQKNIFWHSIF